MIDLCSLLNICNRGFLVDLVLIDQSVGKRSLHLMGTVNGKKRFIYLILFIRKTNNYYTSYRYNNLNNTQISKVSTVNTKVRTN
jgi:hypothetical protein